MQLEKAQIAEPSAGQDMSALAEAMLKAADKISAARRAAASRENGAAGGRPAPPPHADVADAFVERFRTPDGLTLRHWRDTWRLYRPVVGWQCIPEGQLLADLAEYMRADDKLRRHTTTTYMRSVIANLEASDVCGLPYDLPYPCWLSTRESARNWMAFADGHAVNLIEFVRSRAGYADCLRDVEDPAIIRPASADLFSGDFVPYRFAVDPAEHEAWAHDGLWNKYINTSMPDEHGQHAIGQMMAVLLSDESRWEVFFQLFGKGQNGKTVCLDVLQGMVGRGNVSSVPLASLVSDFGGWPLTESKINVTGDMQTDLGHFTSMMAVEGELKHAISGGESQFAKKGKDVFRAKYRARFLMSTNNLPTFVDRSDGIWRRLRVIPFSVQIPDSAKDAELAEKIVRGELSHVFHWAIDYLDMPLQIGHVPEYDEGAKVKASHRRTCDHEAEFLADHFKQDREDFIKTAEVYDDYKQWCQDNGYRSLGAGKFKARVVDVFPSVKEGRNTFGADVCHTFQGLSRK